MDRIPAKSDKLFTDFPRIVTYEAAHKEVRFSWKLIKIARTIQEHRQTYNCLYSYPETVLYARLSQSWLSKKKLSENDLAKMK